MYLFLPQLNMYLFLPQLNMYLLLPLLNMYTCFSRSTLLLPQHKTHLFLPLNMYLQHNLLLAQHNIAQHNTEGD